MNAAGRMDAKGVQFLLDHGGRTDLFDKRGKAALHRAASMGRLETLQLLLRSTNMDDLKRFCLSNYPFTGSPFAGETFPSLVRFAFNHSRSAESA